MGLASLFLPQSAHALQTSASLHVDNDFFDLWQPLAERPDEEYTQGVQLALRWSGTGVILPHLVHGLATCPNELSSEELCGRLSLAFGQDMYTPSIDSPQLIPGQRPYAGWLYLEATERGEGRRRLDLFRLTIGVTGPPSLAEGTQKLWHGWFGYREPLGWGGQLPFEADFGLAYQGARALVPSTGPAPILRLAPVWTVKRRYPARLGPGLYVLAALRGDVRRAQSLPRRHHLPRERTGGPEVAGRPGRGEGWARPSDAGEWSGRSSIADSSTPPNPGRTPMLG